MRKNYQSNVNMLILLLSIMIILQQIGMSHAQEESNHKEETETESKSTTTDDVYELDKILVEGERAYSTASSKMIRDFDLNVRPASTAQDMLQLAPGLVIAQHAGGVKLNRFFYAVLMLTTEQMSPSQLMEFQLIWFHMDTDKDMQTFIL